VRSVRLGERQALRNDRVDLVRTEQLEQREEVFPEPFRIAWCYIHTVAGHLAQPSQEVLVLIVDRH
jgi:hypothetical protein